MVKAENPEAVVAQEPQGRALVTFFLLHERGADMLKEFIRQIYGAHQWAKHITQGSCYFILSVLVTVSLKLLTLT